MNKRQFTWFDYLLGSGFIAVYILGGIIMPLRCFSLVYVANGFWTFKTLTIGLLVWWLIVSGYTFMSQLWKEGKI